MFGPQSITWQGDRETAIFLGDGSSNLGMGKHSDTFADPIGRFDHTFGTVFTVVFGNLVRAVQDRRYHLTFWREI